MAMRYYAPLPGQSGQPFRAASPHVLRIGDAERDAAAADLGEHYVAGRLTLDELHERLGAVFSAKTYGQLSRVMGDLPGLRRPAPRTAWATAYSPSSGFPPSRFRCSLGKFGPLHDKTRAAPVGTRFVSRTVASRAAGRCQRCRKRG